MAILQKTNDNRIHKLYEIGREINTSLINNKGAPKLVVFQHTVSIF